MRRAQKLTPTQRIILDAAAEAPNGTIVMAVPDRKGTRVAYKDSLGRPMIVAYGTPEVFLVTRGFLRRGNEPFTFQITDEGRKARTFRRRRA